MIEFLVGILYAIIGAYAGLREEADTSNMLFWIIGWPIDLFHSVVKSMSDGGSEGGG